MYRLATLGGNNPLKDTCRRRVPPLLNAPGGGNDKSERFLAQRVHRVWGPRDSSSFLQVPGPDGIILQAFLSIHSTFMENIRANYTLSSKSHKTAHKIGPKPYLLG